MSTRCNIEIYDDWNTGTPGVILYHHSDGYPDFMQGKLERFLNKINDILVRIGYHYWWDAERVGAFMIMLSENNYEEPSLPSDISEIASAPHFQPCQQLHGDIEYIWRVYLNSKNGRNSFIIKYEAV